MKCNRVQLADVLGISVQTIDAYLANGMPGTKAEAGTPGVGGQWEFQTKAVIKWLIERAKQTDGAQSFGGENWQAARARDRAAAASLRELELRKALGELITIDSVIAEIEKEYAIVKSKVRCIPSRLAQIIAVQSDPEICQAMLNREVSEALAALSEPGEIIVSVTNAKG